MSSSSSTSASVPIWNLPSGCHVIQWKGLTGVEQLLIVVSAHAEGTTPAQVKTKFITVIRMTNWQEDSGLLTEKTHLLVKQLRFGDTGANMEQCYYALRKFKCYGIQ